MPAELEQFIPHLELRVPTDEDAGDHVAIDSPQGDASDEESDASSVISTGTRYDSDAEHEEQDQDEEIGLENLTVGNATSPSPSNYSELSHISDLTLDPQASVTVGQSPTKESMKQLRDQISELGQSIRSMRKLEPEERDEHKLQMSEREESRLRARFLEGMRKLRDRTAVDEQLSTTDE